jgi:hypothetical protein
MIKKLLIYFFNIDKLHPKEAFLLGGLLTFLISVFVVMGWIAWENMQFLGWV